MAVPLIAGALKVAPKVFGAVKSARALNSEFVKDYSKKTLTRAFDSTGVKKYHNKTKGKSFEVMNKFVEDYGKKLSAQGFDVKDGVAFSGLDGDLVPSLTPKDSEKIIKTPPTPFFKNVGGLGSALQGARTLGGISVLLIIILFIVFAIRPVGDSKETRLSLMFKTLLGMTELDGIASEGDLAKDEQAGFVQKYFQNVDSFANSKTADILSNVSPQLNAGILGYDIGKAIIGQISKSLESADTQKFGGSVVGGIR